MQQKSGNGSRDLQSVMGNLSARLFGTYYLAKVHHDANVLHYKRAPTWRSLVLFAGKEHVYSSGVLMTRRFV